MQPNRRFIIRESMNLVAFRAYCGLFMIFIIVYSSTGIETKPISTFRTQGLSIGFLGTLTAIIVGHDNLHWFI